MTYKPQILSVDLGVSSGSVITVGEKGSKVIPIAGRIISWSITVDPEATVELAVWKANETRPIISDIITPSPGPTVTANTFTTSSSLIGWDTAIVDEEDVVVLEVISNDLATFILLSLKIRAT